MRGDVSSNCQGERPQEDAVFPRRWNLDVRRRWRKRCVTRTALGSTSAIGGRPTSIENLGLAPSFESGGKGAARASVWVQANVSVNRRQSHFRTDETLAVASSVGSGTSAQTLRGRGLPKRRRRCQRSIMALPIAAGCDAAPRWCPDSGRLDGRRGANTSRRACAQTWKAAIGQDLVHSASSTPGGRPRSRKGRCQHVSRESSVPRRFRFQRSAHVCQHVLMAEESRPELRVVGACVDDAARVTCVGLPVAQHWGHARAMAARPPRQGGKRHRRLSGGGRAHLAFDAGHPTRGERRVR
mmetsp:Transcript_89450/g.251944  ORF Transcript_89450/g.251944 Transcript_89450/m.251944 type:complete len:298 (+) Transcript_89450:880-1773(+)